MPNILDLSHTDVDFLTLALKEHFFITAVKNNSFSSQGDYNA